MDSSEEQQLVKITLNLYAADVKFLEVWYGYGWSAQVREMIHERVKRIKEQR